MSLTLALSLVLLTTGTEDPTFTKDVAPILWKNCAGCHRPGEVGPFPLLTYKDAVKRTEFLKEITASRRMPPWKPEPEFGEFLDARRLTDAELKTIADWVDAGAPEGEPDLLPAPPTFPEGWQLGEPDLVLKMTEAFAVPASGRDVHRAFVIPIPTDGDRTVAAVEFRPGNPKVVHHAIFYLDTTGAARKKDEDDPLPGYGTFGGPGITPTGALGGWAPGALPRKLPEGTGKYLKAGSDLVLQIHYHPDGKPELDQSTVGITFTKTFAKKIVSGIPVRSRDIYIPAGESNHQVHAESPALPVDVDAIGIAPHMHNLGRTMKVVAETPSGQTVPLIWIKDWDFNWQGQYQYQEPVHLPKGTVIKLDATYDNSSNNPRNPSNPPKLVKWGEQTTDEMCLLGVQVTTANMADLRQVMAMNREALLGSFLGGAAPGGRPGAGALRKAAEAMKNAGGLRGAGFPIPPAAKAQLERFDTNNDGRISEAELSAMPAPVQSRIRERIAALTGGAAGKDAAGKTTAGPGAAGFAIPEPQKQLLGRFDTNNDGRISEAELNAMPGPLQTRIRERIEERKSGKP
jgi:hypothetical protein